MAKEKTLRIFCFGDSLTAGYSSNGAVYHPYSVAMTRKLSADLSNTQIIVADNGMPGDVVSQGAFAQRFETEVRQDTYDWVIILGGTNDLSLNVPPERIFASLKSVWDSALAKGCRVLALTVPERELTTSDDQRKRLNSLILKHEAPNFRAFDLAARIPFHDLNERERRRYWDDGVHLTPAGYDWMGGFVAEALGNYVELERNPHSRRSRRTKRSTDEAVSFEEESGDPRDLRAGYVFVRLRDLD
ncbi:hypothetical protein Cob_v001074 [Colletotrichum orbiculare MAFF 240422]|uniref:SGNH hydrolase-type esterase domain-containing protein n=1 Tax=Colletotrichum orbiculare (strain 104-T / ATCC 96160 / CBS 514.97 / LARS 414 / MAFF 240422) TaxID=1213857 RepID=N4VMZ5_COLOR|nr:hypothetical protein Cob_v001074 [Colletotrichum orbiculare MAFF 240422]